MIRASGNSPRIAMVASRPFISGICKSIRVTSGRCVRNCWIASRPLDAWPTKLMSDWPATSAAIPSRRRTWSSTARIRIELAPNRQLTSHELRAFAHTAQTVVPGGPVFIKMLGVDALSVIPDPQPKMPFVIPDFHFDPLRLCVPEGVAKCLPCDPVDFVPQYRMEILGRAFHLHMKLGSIGVRFTGREFLA